MNEQDDMSAELLLDHGQHPRNFREMPGASRRASAHNPTCGDRIELFLRLEGETIAEASFTGSGCSISLASASIMTQFLKGRRIDEALALFDDFHATMTDATESAVPERLGKLAAFAGVRKYPIRVKCATMPWHTLQQALRSNECK